MQEEEVHTLGRTLWLAALGAGAAIGAWNTVASHWDAEWLGTRYHFLLLVSALGLGGLGLFALSGLASLGHLYAWLKRRKRQRLLADHR